MKIAALFAGVGGLEVGLGRSGHHANLFCEVWKPAAAVLSANFDGVDIRADVRDLTDLPGDTDLVTAGFPCQDLSQAGRTAGINGKRSGLVDHVFRLLDASNAELVLLENVPFMLRLDRGRAMKRLTDAFEERGFRWAYRRVNSLSFVPQRRERVFMLASQGDLDPASVLCADEADSPVSETKLGQIAHGFYWTEGTRGLGWAIDATPPLKNGSTVGIPSPPAIILPNGEIIKPDIRDAERLQGFEPDWTKAAEEVGRASLRWSLVGNAITVPVAEWIGSRLSEPGVYDQKRDLPLERGSAWPNAARWDGHERHAVQISDFPFWKERSPLHEFLEHPGTPLSERATAGFYKRASASSLRFPEGFLPRVAAHLDRMRSEKENSTAERARAVA